MRISDCSADVCSSDLKETAVPVDVIGKVVAGAPCMLEAGDPGNAFLWPVLHLHDMRDGVGGPDVAGVARDGVAAGHLRGAIVAGLLEGEGLQDRKRVV